MKDLNQIASLNPSTPLVLYKIIIHFLPYFHPGSCKMSRENNQLEAIITVFQLEHLH